MRSRSRWGIRHGLAALIMSTTLCWSAGIVYSYYKADRGWENINPPSRRAEITQNYVKLWERSNGIIKYNPFVMGYYLSAKKYAQENPLKKKGIQI